MSEENKTPETTPEKPAEAEKPAATETPATEKAPAAAAAAKPAAEKKEEPPAPPDPRFIAGTERLESIKGKIVAKFGEGVLEGAEVKQFTPTLIVKNANWVEVVEYVKTDPSLAFIYPECMAGTDYKDYIEVYVNVHSFELGYDLALKVRTPRDNASVPSITPLFGGLNWEEREIYDLLGVTFEGHPDLRRIMLPDEWQGHPLRKDYVVKD